MADPVSQREIGRMPVQDYQALRPALRSGDLMFAAGRYLVSKAIQRVTGGAWSHVGLLFRARPMNRILLLESVEDQGVRLLPLSNYLHDYASGKPYRGRIVLARCRGLQADAACRALDFGLAELGQPYDNDEIARILARISLGVGKARRDREYICSELVRDCLQQAGLPVPLNAAGFIAPSDLWADARIRPLGRIR